MHYNKTCTFMTGYLLIFLISCHYPNEKSASESKPYSDYEVVAEDGAWYWFSDPRAVYHKGEKGQIYYGYNSSGDVVIRSKSINNGIIHIAILHEKLNKDDHAIPSILILSGKLLAFYSAYNGHQVYRKSTHPEDLTSRKNEKIILDDSSMRYTNPVMLSDENNRIYLFGRVVPPMAKNKDQYSTYWELCNGTIFQT